LRLVLTGEVAVRIVFSSLAAALLLAAALIGSGAVPLSGKTLFAFSREISRTTEIAKLGDTHFTITRKQPQTLALRADRSLGYWLLGAGLICAVGAALSRK